MVALEQDICQQAVVISNWRRHACVHPGMGGSIVFISEMVQS